MAVKGSAATVLVLRFADVGVATYASLRVVGELDRLVTWVVDDTRLRSLVDDLAAALPDPNSGEPIAGALDRAFTTGAYAAFDSERALAERLGTLLADQAWDLLAESAGTSPPPLLFVSPSARLSRVPWALLAEPAGDRRLIELADVMMAAPPNIVNAPRHRADPASPSHLVVAILDPKVPGQRADSALGSILGRPSADSPLARHFAARPVLPEVRDPAELFRRTDTNRAWLVGALAQRPTRLIYVGHASAPEDRVGHADRAALHLSESEPLAAADIIAARLPIPPRVALLACSSGGDYRFDEATGLVAAMILGGARVVTATLWSLPTTAGYRRFAAPAGPADPMAELIIAVDGAHSEDAPAHAVNRWQRGCLRRWRDGDTTASPLYWAALVNFAVDGAR